MMKFIVAGIAASVLGLPALAETEPAETCSARHGGQVQVTTVKVNGMVCDFCARAVTKVFTKNDLVDAVDVDLDAGTIIFETHGCLILDEDTIMEMVHYSGYDFVSLERSFGQKTELEAVAAED